MMGMLAANLQSIETSSALSGADLALLDLADGLL